MVEGGGEKIFVADTEIQAPLFFSSTVGVNYPPALLHLFPKSDIL